MDKHRDNLLDDLDVNNLGGRLTTRTSVRVDDDGRENLRSSWEGGEGKDRLKQEAQSSHFNDNDNSIACSTQFGVAAH